MEVSNDACIKAQENTKFKVIKGSIEDNSSWEDNFFDIITIFDVLEHISKPREALKEVNRIMKPKGILYISTLNFNSFARRFESINWPLLSPPGHMSYFTKQNLVYLLQSHGFEILKIRCFGIASNNKKLQRINSLMTRKFKKIGKLFELTNLGDYIDVIAKKIIDNIIKI